MDYKSNEQSIIEEGWPKEKIGLYITDFEEQKKYTRIEYRLDLQEKLFLTSVVSFFLEDRETVDNVLNKTRGILKRNVLPMTKLLGYTEQKWAYLKPQFAFHLTLWASCYGVESWQSLRRSDRKMLSRNVNPFLTLVKEFTNEDVDNYNRWKSYVKTQKQIMPISALYTKLTQVVFHPLNFDSHLDFVIHAYSCYYYLYDKNETSFSDNIFDIIRQEDSKWAHRLYHDLNGTDFRNEIHLEYLEYCDRKGIQERDLFRPKKGRPQKEATPSPNNNSTLEEKASVVSEDYYSNLVLNDKGIRNLYHLLVEEEFILKDTPYSIFHFRLSGRDKPDNLTKIVWLKDKKELCYFIYRLTRTNILDEKCCELSTTRDFNKKIIVFFIVEGSNWDEKDNLSDMANKLSYSKKQEILELFKKSLEQP